MNTIYQLAFLSLFTVSLSSWSELYKCKNDNDELSYSDRPCSSNAELFTPNPIITEFVDIKINHRKTPKKEKIKKTSHSCPFISSAQQRNLRVKQTYIKGLPSSEILKRFGKPDKTEGMDNKGSWTYKNKKYKLEFKFQEDCLLSWKEKWFVKKSKIDKYR